MMPFRFHFRCLVINFLSSRHSRKAILRLSSFAWRRNLRYSAPRLRCFTVMAIGFRASRGGVGVAGFADSFLLRRAPSPPPPKWRWHIQ